MNDKQWTEEVERTLAGAGLPCRVHAAWIQQSGEMYYAELTDTRSGKERKIGLSSQEFPTVIARRAEIVRQAGGHPA